MPVAISEPFWTEFAVHSGSRGLPVPRTMASLEIDSQLFSLSRSTVPGDLQVGSVVIVAPTSLQLPPFAVQLQASQERVSS